MSKIELPEQVRVAHVKIAPMAIGMGYEEVPIEIGEDEVALLLSYNLLFLPEVNTGVQSMQTFLWKKSQPKDYPGALAGLNAGWFKDSDILFAEEHVLSYTGVGNDFFVSPPPRYVVLPYPVVLIRSPSFIYYMSAPIGVIYCSFWYLLERITDEQLAKLMVKDHA